MSANQSGSSSGCGKAALVIGIMGTLLITLIMWGTSLEQNLVSRQVNSFTYGAALLILLPATVILLVIGLTTVRSWAAGDSRRKLIVVGLALGWFVCSCAVPVVVSNAG